jgi:hypothetical protein
MQHHRPGNRHDGANVSLGDAIVMMSTDTGEPDDLFEVGKVAEELSGGERLGASCRRNTLAE